MSYNFSELFGKQLNSKSGDVDTDATLSGKNVMVYFSAHCE